MVTMMSNEGARLDLYSNDILMQSFPDASTLGAALVAMEEQPLDPRVVHRMEVGLDVISTLVQARRSKDGLEELLDSLQFLGSMGIKPDAETMEYFRPQQEPAVNSPNSRHHTRLLMPHKRRMRSLLDIEFPDGLGPVLDLPDRSHQRSEWSAKNLEPYFESGQNQWAMHTKALMAALEPTDESTTSDSSSLSIESRESVSTLTDIWNELSPSGPAPGTISEDIHDGSVSVIEIRDALLRQAQSRDPARVPYGAAGRGAASSGDRAKTTAAKKSKQKRSVSKTTMKSNSKVSKS